MSSSISTSEPLGWRRALRRYAVCCLAFAMLAAALILAVDPYDTGRLTPLRGGDVPIFGQRLTAASIAREPDAQAAIVGNSTIQLIDPSRLGGETGLKFVSLAIPGSGPLEQFAVARWFMREHPVETERAARALVFGLDRSWCRDDGKLELSNPFPFWLYGDNDIEYAKNLMRLESFGAAWRKVQIVLGLKAPLRRDGFRSYDTGQSWDAPDAERYFGAAPDAGRAPPGEAVFLAATLTEKFLREAPGKVAIVLLFPPRHYSSLPPPESTGAQVEDLCKKAFRDLAATRGRMAVLDFARDSESVHKDDNFFDQIHYRLPVAHLVEASIGEALRRIRTSE